MIYIFILFYFIFLLLLLLLLFCLLIKSPREFFTPEAIFFQSICLSVGIKGDDFSNTD